jgi:hypothetical protein
MAYQESDLLKLLISGDNNVLFKELAKIEYNLSSNMCNRLIIETKYMTMSNYVYVINNNEIRYSTKKLMISDDELKKNNIICFIKRDTVQ